jgi:hypothetical protein
VMLQLEITPLKIYTKCRQVPDPPSR